MQAVCEALALVSTSSSRLQRLILTGCVMESDSFSGFFANKSFAPKLFEVAVTLRDVREVSGLLRVGAATKGDSVVGNRAPSDYDNEDLDRAAYSTPWRQDRTKQKRLHRPCCATRLVARLAHISGNLVALSLCGAQLAAETYTRFAQMTRLTALDVSFAFIGPKGSVALAGLRYIRKLDVHERTSQCHEDFGAIALAALLDRAQENCSLRTNYRKYAADALELGSRRQQPPSTTITHLDVSANRVADRGGRTLALALRRSRVLTCIDVSHNLIGAAACALLLATGVPHVHGARSAGARIAHSTPSRIISDDILKRSVPSSPLELAARLRACPTPKPQMYRAYGPKESSTTLSSQPRRIAEERLELSILLATKPRGKWCCLTRQLVTVPGRLDIRAEVQISKLREDCDFCLTRFRKLEGDFVEIVWTGGRVALSQRPRPL